jgi:CHAD domain-containing protein
MAVSITETETKYDAPAEAALPDLGGLPDVASLSASPEQRLEAEYFDTEDLRLIRAGITLRRRTGGDDEGWHLKLPAGPASRTEIRLPLGRSAHEVPAELAELVRVRVRDKSLQPVASVTTRRRTIALIDPASNSLAEVADDQVTGTRRGDPAAGSSSILSWREVEVELTGGGPGLLQAADELLRRHGLRPAGRSAKLERVLGIGPATRDTESRLSPSSPANQVVVAYLRNQAQALVALDPMVRRDLPDTVHQMRIATRRLRSTLRTFGAVVGGADAARLADELKWLGAVLGAARDAEVQARRIGQQVGHTEVELLLGPVQARVQVYFAKAQATTRAGLLDALNSQRYYSLLDLLDAVVSRSPLGPDADSPARSVLPAAVCKSYRKTRRRIRRARRAPAGRARDDALHRARKAAKQARYAAEAAQPAAGPNASQFARRMMKLQSVLGNHQDTVVGRELLRHLGIAADHAGESAFSYGLLYGREQTRAQDLQATAWRVWRKSSRRRYREWMKAGSQPNGR